MRVKDAKYMTDSDPLLTSHVILSPFSRVENIGSAIKMSCHSEN